MAEGDAADAGEEVQVEDKPVAEVPVEEDKPVEETPANAPADIGWRSHPIARSV